MKKILITGVTGVLGSEILYTLLAEKLDNHQPMEIAVLVRPSAEHSAEHRLQELLTSDTLPHNLSRHPLSSLVASVKIVEGDLSAFDYNDTIPFTLIHVAAVVHLDTKASTRERIIEDNYEATVELIQRFHDRIEHLIFVSTAYACGKIQGQVDNDYLSLERSTLTFRNHYEEYKFRTEQKINTMSAQHGFRLSIVRPSIICGRLLEEPLYSIRRYIVFYLMGKFFSEVSYEGIDKNQVIRIQACQDISLNVVPVDYVAKGVVKVLHHPSIKQLNLVHSKPLPVTRIIDKALSLNGFTNYTYVHKEPKDKSRIESIFYRTVAKQLVQYVDTSHHTFDTRELREILSDIPEPDIEDAFDALFEFAHSRNYEN